MIILGTVSDELIPDFHTKQPDYLHTVLKYVKIGEINAGKVHIWQ